MKSQAHILDNPVWSSLTTAQRHFAVRDRDVLRYPTAMAPFVAVEQPSHETVEALRLITSGEGVYFLGVIPDLPERFAIQERSSFLQMICEAAPIEQFGDPALISTLDEASAADMLALTNLVYPGFFRSDTHKLGRYFGIWSGSRLAAMAGERMFAGTYREISGVCTHPDFVGRGYAAQLIAHLITLIVQEGNTPFLHVGKQNRRALSLYERLGFRQRSELSMLRVRR
jgi:ribosomal protein S18 acetylase RimI-like enzyme